jgi:hypothetical protein
MKTIKIVDRYDATHVLYECEAATLRAAVVKAVASGVDLRFADLRDANLRYVYLGGANLRYVYLSGANLSGANLSCAHLVGADLRDANLSDADLGGANLSGANLGGADLRHADLVEANLRHADLVGANLRHGDLSRANLSRADLSGASLSGADLSDADLGDANLSGANLRDAKTDVFAVLDLAPKEVPGLLAAMHAGKIDGSVYDGGDCSCLVGTIAKVRGCDVNGLGDLKPAAFRPSERLFLALKPGDSPANHPIAQIVAEWIGVWLEAHPPEVTP